MSGDTRNRRNWTRSLTVATIVAAVAVVIGWLVDVETGKTDRLYLRNTGGAVLFDHGMHGEVADSCVQCHHDLSVAEEEVEDQAEAISCRQCHPGVQPSETFTASCTECHDDDYSPEMMEHDEYLEVEEHACLDCHSPRPVSEAYHMNCSPCHLEYSPERFTQADGELLCGACHLR